LESNILLETDIFLLCSGVTLHLSNIHFRGPHFTVLCRLLLAAGRERSRGIGIEDEEAKQGQRTDEFFVNQDRKFVTIILMTPHLLAYI